MSKTKRTGKSLLETSNTASTATMLTLGFSESQAKRLMRVRRTLPMMEDSKAPCIDARKLWEHLGKPHKRFNMWADSYIKPLLFTDGFTAEISALKVQVRGTPRTDYKLSRDLSASLAMMARTSEGNEIRQYFLDMERLAVRLADHMDIRVDAIIGTDNKVTHQAYVGAGNAAKKGIIRRSEVADEAKKLEIRIKSIVREVLSGFSREKYISLFGNRSLRDVLDTQDLHIYAQCYELARSLFTLNDGKIPANLIESLKKVYKALDMNKYLPTPQAA
jgi:anti-repressor protein